MRETPPPASGSSYPEMVLEQVSRMAREHLLVPSHNHAIHRFGDHLAEIRVVRGLSLVELERRAGITLLRLFSPSCVSAPSIMSFSPAPNSIGSLRLSTRLRSTTQNSGHSSVLNRRYSLSHQSRLALRKQQGQRIKRLFDKLCRRLTATGNRAACLSGKPQQPRHDIAL